MIRPRSQVRDARLRVDEDRVKLHEFLAFLAALLVVLLALSLAGTH